MRMIASVRIESDDGTVAEESTNTVGVDTRVRGIDPDAAKEDFIAQARGLLSSVGETHVPAMFATVQQRIDDGEAEAEQAEESKESEGMAKVRGKLRQLRRRKADNAEQETEGEDDGQEGRE